MATNIKIIHASDFIKVTPEGRLDLEKSKKILLEIVSASASLTDYETLLDTRNTQSVLSITDLWYLAEGLFQFRKIFNRKTAILCPIEGFDHAGFFALCAQNRGYLIKAFSSYENAIQWLIEN